MKKKLNTVKIGKKSYKIYHLCQHEIRNGYHIMVNIITGSLMTWEDGRKRIKL